MRNFILVIVFCLFALLIILFQIIYDLVVGFFAWILGTVSYKFWQ